MAEFRFRFGSSFFIIIINIFFVFAIYKRTWL